MDDQAVMKTGTDSVELKAFGKINLCLDVLGKMDGGYHRVEMVMQQIALHDSIRITWTAGEGRDIHLTSDDERLPDGEENLAWKAADLMWTEWGADRRGRLDIHIAKRIPMAAGLAGGSSDCGAVLHGINRLWDLGLDVERLCDLGARLGSDVPFCIMGQAAADEGNVAYIGEDPLAAHCAIARGRGTDLTPVQPLISHILISRPDVNVSTREVYEAIDDESINERPDTEAMVAALKEKNNTAVEKNMVNVLEKVTLKRYPVVVYTKNKIQDTCSHRALMSGSGPTVFCLCDTEEEAEALCREMKMTNEESYSTKTTF